MNDSLSWWRAPRNVSVVVDNPSWFLPHAENLVQELIGQGDNAVLARGHEDILENGVAFYLGCIHITPDAILARNYRNLVVHASNLPEGRGFSPLTHLTLAGETQIPICLIEAVSEVDAGPVVYRDVISFEGHELLDEMQMRQGAESIALCCRFMSEASPPSGEAQTGTSSHFARRYPNDSRLDPEISLADQFNLLRTVDNLKYPAFFDHRGHRYKLSIEKLAGPGSEL